MPKPMGGKILLIRRKYVTAMALCIAVLAIFYVINHPALVGVSARERSWPVYSGPGAEQRISLTFNLREAGDNHTVQVLEALQIYGVRATFFVTGDWVRANEDLAAAMVAAGHELMNLSDDHSFLNKMATTEIMENVENCNDVIAGISGIRPSFFRAPYGAYNDNLVGTIRAMGMEVVQWSIDSGDWRGLSAQAIARRVGDQAFAGGIVLLHSDLEQTALAIPDLIDGLFRAGYIPVLVSEILG